MTTYPKSAAKGSWIFALDCGRFAGTVRLDRVDRPYSTSEPAKKEPVLSNERRIPIENWRIGTVK